LRQSSDAVACLLHGQRAAVDVAGTPRWFSLLARAAHHALSCDLAIVLL